jgi:hypothetical protein
MVEKMKKYGRKGIWSLCSAVLGVWLAACAGAELAQAAEAAPTASAQSLLGADVSGENWTVASEVQSDGFLRVFDVSSSYGDFQVNGRRRMSERLQELRAMQILEQMSRTEVFTDALESGAMAPINFGRDFVGDPIETTGNVISGVGRRIASVAGSVRGAIMNDGPAGRDPLVERIVGITRTERELAYQLGVDPYSDFVPLRNGLTDVAHVSVAGGFSVSTAISAIPGGAGIVASYSSRGASYSGTTQGMTSGAITNAVLEKLLELDVEEDTALRFTDNMSFSPNDLYAVATALEMLGAENTEGFISLAADAGSADVAKFHRHRAELLASELVRERLGSLGEFVVVAGVALNRNAEGSLVAVFPFDVVSWTYSTQAIFVPLSDEISRSDEPNAPILAMTGELTRTARSELQRLGWTLAGLE